MTYEEYCRKRLSQNCRPVSEIEWQTKMSSREIVEFAKEKRVIK